MNSVSEKVLQNTLQRVNSAFNFEEHEIRTLVRSGEPWFIASDVCNALGLSNPSKSVASLDDDEKVVVNGDSNFKLESPGRGAQSMIIINESGLYTLILRCRDAVNRGSLPWRFRKWVTSEVLPTIRKSGQYRCSSTVLPSSMMFVTDRDNVLEFRDGSLTQLNVLFACVDRIRNDLWPHLSALFPGLNTEYNETFVTLAMVSGLLKNHKFECKMMADEILRPTK